MYYDLCTTPECDLQKIVGIAEKLGCDGLVVIQDQPAKGPNTKVDIVRGVMITPKNQFDLRQAVDKFRRKAEIVVAVGGTPDANRMIAETPEVDILSKPFGADKLAMDHVICRASAENNVAVDFCLGDLVHTYKRSRAVLFSKMIKAAKLVRKYKTPFVITSGAVTEWDLRSPSELISFGRLLGFQDDAIKDALSGSIAKENRKRLSGKWVMPGVEIEK